MKLETKTFKDLIVKGLLHWNTKTYILAYVN
jgi:hypothetical protein